MLIATLLPLHEFTGRKVYISVSDSETDVAGSLWFPSVHGNSILSLGAVYLWVDLPAEASFPVDLCPSTTEIPAPSPPPA